MPRLNATKEISHGTNIGADYSDEERLFLRAIDTYKRTRNRPYLTWQEVLAIVQELGYRKVEDQKVTHNGGS